MRQPASGPGGGVAAPAEEAPALAWVEAYRRRHGRAPRVLHIGNIANNAYNNAKILNRAGFDCDVICYDYYHIMGCPEWEDADFSGDFGDHFRPRWWQVNLNGFRRPGWFAQGPMSLCIEYLLARRQGQAARARKLWRILNIANGTRRASAWELKALWWSLLEDVKRIARKLLDEDAIERKLRAWYRVTSLKCVLFDDKAIERKLRAWYRANPLFGTPVGNAASRGVTVALRVLRAGRQIARRALARVIFMSYRAVCMVGRRLGARVARLRASIMRHAEVHVDDPDAIFAFVRERYAQAFPQRSDMLTRDDTERFRYCLQGWKRLFAHYDIVIGYATDPILPFLARNRYFALEHGTLREIPLRKDWLGRLTAVAYHYAEHVFVTNFDCMDNARSLIGNERCTFINHPFDEDHGIRVRGVPEARRDLTRLLDSDFLIFFPTRHDWVAGRGYADKANDRLLRAVALLRREGHAIGVVCCRWGANVRESMQLVTELGLSGRVLWRDPMGVIEFERMCQACDLVADQFQLGSFGGITFKAMAVGTPVCTYIDRALVEKMYPQAPPVLNCRTEKEIGDTIRRCVKEPERLSRLGAAGREWMKAYHSSADTVFIQAERFRAFLENR